MKHEDVKVGMKVVPHSKSIYCAMGFDAWTNCYVGKKFVESGYLVVTGIDNCEWIMLDDENDTKVDGYKPTGDYFLASDFELYVEPPKHLTNSQLWALVESGGVSNSDKFERDREVHVYWNGQFYIDEDIETVFSKDDKWIKVEFKPKLTKAQAEMEFGIEIVD